MFLSLSDYYVLESKTIINTSTVWTNIVWLSSIITILSLLIDFARVLLSPVSSSFQNGKTSRTSSTSGSGKKVENVPNLLLSLLIGFARILLQFFVKIARLAKCPEHQAPPEVVLDVLDIKSWTCSGHFQHFVQNIKPLLLCHISFFFQLLFLMKSNFGLNIFILFYFYLELL